MGKIKIEIKKPQYVTAKEQGQELYPTAQEPSGLPGLFKFLLFLTYAFCAVALWFAAQIFLAR